MTSVTVIVPIYNAVAAAERCLRAVLASTADDEDVVIVAADDASPDGRVGEMLDRVSDEWPDLVVVCRDTNLGFPMNCNLAMAEAEGDIVLLNSDTQVASGWLAPMRDLAARSERVGSVTPLTSNGEIASVPVWLADNGLPDGMTVDSMGELVGSVGSGDWIEIPTGVGFCLYLTRRGLDKVGDFDAALFGSGYGEENDLCLRLRQAGFVNLLSDLSFVHHDGGRSFGEKRSALIQRNLRTVNLCWPGYDQLIANYVDDNPLAGCQARVGLELVRRSKDPDRHRILHVLHNPIESGHVGGTEFHVADLVRHSQMDALVLSTVAGRPILQAASVGDFAPFPIGVSTRSVRLPEAPGVSGATVDDGWISALLGAGVDLVHIHHLSGFDPEVADHLLQAVRKRGIPMIYTVHDYYALCPNFQMLDADTQDRCGFDRGRACRGCDRLVDGPADRGVAEWRDRWSRRLRDATIVAPSSAAASYLASWGSGDPVIIPHGLDGNRANVVRRSTRTMSSGAEVHRVAVLGYGGHHKGDTALVGLLDAVEGLGGGYPQIEWHLFGRRDLADGRPGVVAHGGYDRATIADRLREENLAAVLLLSNWPETYSYTLSEAWKAGLFAVVADQGALAERVRLTGAGVVLPGDSDIGDARVFLDLLADLDRRQKLEDNAASAGASIPSCRQMAGRYDELYARLGPSREASMPRYGYSWSISDRVALISTFYSPLPAPVSVRGGLAKPGLSSGVNS